MGALFSNAFLHLFGKKETRLIMVGLDNAGKTTILYKLNLGEITYTIPSIGFNVETIHYQNITFNAWDIGTHDEIRLQQQRNHYYPHTHGIIFVIDSHDKDRIGLAKEELHRMMAEHGLNGSALLIIANKQDLQGAMKPAEVAEALSLTNLKEIKWHVQGACANVGDGLLEGFDWLAKFLPPKN
jgi:ADP-ribosylation factor protein 1